MAPRLLAHALQTAIRHAQATPLGLVHLDGTHCRDRSRALRDTLAATAGRFLVLSQGAPPPARTRLHTPGPAGVWTCPGPASSSDLAFDFTRANPDLDPQRAAARALRTAGLPLAIAGDCPADAALFARWCDALPTGPERRPLLPAPAALRPWVGRCPLRADAAARLWRLREWARILIQGGQDASTIAQGIHNGSGRSGALVVLDATADREHRADALKAAAGGTLFVRFADCASPSQIEALVWAAAQVDARFIAHTAVAQPDRAALWDTLCVHAVAVPTPPATPPIHVVSPGESADRAVLHIPALHRQSLAAIRTAASLALRGRPIEDRVLRAIQDHRWTDGIPGLMAMLDDLHQRLPPGPLTGDDLRTLRPDLAPTATDTPIVIRIRLGTHGLPAIRQTLTTPTATFSSANEPGSIGLDGLPEALARSVEVVRTRGHLTAHLRAPLPPAMHVRAWTLREASSGADAIEVTLHCPVHLGPAGVLALHWAPGISVEVELHASPVTADARVPQLPEAPPLTVDEQDVLVDAVLIAADGPLPWNEALPRELRRISGTATGRRAAARVWTVDPICALADLMTGDGGAPPAHGTGHGNSGPGTRRRDHRAAAPPCATAAARDGTPSLGLGCAEALNPPKMP